MVEIIVKFVVIQLLQALITAQMIKDSVLEVLKLLAEYTKGMWEKHLYNRVKFYFSEPESEHVQIPQNALDAPVEQPGDENK